jgi:hypothetical protein
VSAGTVSKHAAVAKMIPRKYAAAASDAAANARLPDEIIALTSVSYRELQTAWRRHFRYPAPKKLSRSLLELGIAWKIQERAQGGLSAANRRKLDEMARTLSTNSDLARPRTTALKPGARLIRDWGGQTHEILVTENGFLWRGKTWASLSIIAREITGTRWSGPRFFGLGAKQDRDINA